MNRMLLLAGIAVFLGAAAPALRADEPPLTLEPAEAFRIGLARRFAPEVRFHAHVPGASDSLQNVNEDFLPGSVDAFYDALAAGRYPLVVQRSRGPAPARVRTVPSRPTARFEPEPERGRITGYPMRMAGSPAGEAPVYVHVYPEAAAARARPGGGSERDWFCEYWLFYPFDWTCSRILGRIGCKGAHRGDWEHTSYRVRIVTDEAGAVTGAQLVHGEHFAHGWSYVVPAELLSTVGDDGEVARAGAGADHPRVYVAQGKHGSYHAPGELHDWVAGALSDHDDFFYGNGVVFRVWETDLVDIGPEAKAAHPERFAPPGFQALLARSEGIAPPTWLDFLGRWGPDLEGIGALVWTSSPTGPYAKGSWGDEAASARPLDQWRARWKTKLTWYAPDDPRVARVEPAPAPAPPAPR